MRQFDLTQYFRPDADPKIANFIFIYNTTFGALLTILVCGIYHVLKISPMTCSKDNHEMRVTFDGMAAFCYVDNIWTQARPVTLSSGLEIPVDKDMNFVSIRYDKLLIF